MFISIAALKLKEQGYSKHFIVRKIWLVSFDIITVSSACASGSHAIGIAATLIRHGMQDVILCGGAQEVNMYAMSSFDALGVFSHQIEDPHKASCPFDRDRQGLVPSGGAAALVLESYDHATKRGATILAEVAGYGFSSNGGGKLSTPSCAPF